MNQFKDFDTKRLIERLGAAGWPYLAPHGMCVNSGENAWLRALPNMSLFYLVEVDRLLKPIEDQQQRDRNWMAEYDKKRAEQERDGRNAEREHIRRVLSGDGW